MESLTKDSVLNKLSQTWCDVEFEKANGEKRNFSATRNVLLIPEDAKPKTGTADDESDIIRVYAENTGWRSFAFSRLLAFSSK